MTNWLLCNFIICAVSVQKHQKHIFFLYGEIMRKRLLKVEKILKQEKGFKINKKS